MHILGFWGLRLSCFIAWEWEALVVLPTKPDVRSVGSILLKEFWI